MKITDIKIHVLKPTLKVNFGLSDYLMRWCAVQVFTDEGIIGEFITRGFEDPDSVGKSLSNIRSDIIGKDPFDREKIITELSFKWRYPAYLLGIIDVLLWDVAGKVTEMPIYKLLGAQKDKILAYGTTLSYTTDEEFVNIALECKKKGYKAVKIHTHQNWKKDIALIRTVREAVGDDVLLMCDPLNGYIDRIDALKVGKELEKLDYLWYEDPLPSTDIDGLEELCKKLDIDIVMGEDFTSFSQHATYIRRNANDVLRTAIEQGGITGAMKVAHLAECFGMKCEPGNYGSMPTQAAHLHIELANQNCRFYEMPIPEGIFDICMKETARIDGDGYIRAPTKPGLGYEIDWNEVNRNTIKIY